MANEPNVLLDSSVIIAHFRHDQAIASQLAMTENLFVSLTAVGELYAGAYRAADVRKTLVTIREFLKPAIVLELDESTAAAYGQIHAELSVAGNVIPQNDIWIAAC